MKKDKHASSLKIILIITTIFLVLLEFYSLTTGSHYKYDFIFLILLLYVVYFFRKILDLHWKHYALFAFFLLLHNLGTFGTYSLSLFGMEYDFYVHAFFGFVAVLLLSRAAFHATSHRGFLVPFFVLLIVLGLSALHELYEFAGALLLGEGEGVLFIGAGDLDAWDTQKDMLHNFLGGLVAVLVILFKRPLSLRKRT